MMQNIHPNFSGDSNNNHHHNHNNHQMGPQQQQQYPMISNQGPGPGPSPSPASMSASGAGMLVQNGASPPNQIHRLTVSPHSSLLPHQHQQMQQQHPNHNHLTLNHAAVSSHHHQQQQQQMQQMHQQQQHRERMQLMQLHHQQNHMIAQHQQQQQLHAGDQQQQQQQVQCFKCGKMITDRHLLQALDHFWHEDCLKCTACGCRLGEVGSKLYQKANQILCKIDYYRMFGQTGTCSGCGKQIPAYEEVMRARDHNYHVKCFICVICKEEADSRRKERRTFAIGEKFYLSLDNRILCEQHEVMITGSNNSNNKNKTAK